MRVHHLMYMLIVCFVYYLHGCVLALGRWELSLDTHTPLCLPLLQLDTGYRRKWDALVIKLEVVDRDLNTGSEVVHWATHFPVRREASSHATLCHLNTFMGIGDVRTWSFHFVVVKC